MPAHPGELAVVAPRHAIVARGPIKLAALGVFGEEVQPAFSPQEPRLRIRDLPLTDALERRDAERFLAAVDEPRPMARATADENPDVALVIELDAAVVVRVVHDELVVNDGRARHPAGLVVETRRHHQQMPLALDRAAVGEERLVSLRRIDRHRVVVGCVGAQPARILVAMFRELAECEPDASVTVHLARDRSRRRLGDFLFGCRCSEGVRA